MTLLEPQPIIEGEPAREYVAGGDSWWMRSRNTSLPFPFDDLTEDFGDDLYDRMYLDPQCAAVLNVLRAGVIEEGVQLSPPEAVAAADVDGHDLAKEIAAFCRSVLEDLETPLDDVLWDMLAALRNGSRVAEQVYSEEQLQRRERLVLRALKVKPHRATAFVVDPFMNVVGLQVLQPARPTEDEGAAKPRNPVIDRSKFAVLSFRPENGDPRGRSIYRPAYTPWWAKMQVWPEFLKYLARFASPSIYGTVGEKAQEVVIKNADGTTTKKSAVEVLFEALLAFRNGSAGAFPYGTLLNVLEATGDGAPFLNAFTRADQQITVGVLHQSRATLEAEHGSRADSESGQDVLDTIVRQIKRSVCRMLRLDVLRPMVAYTYGEEAAASLTPVPSLGSVERRDVAKMATAIAAMAKQGLIFPSQLPGIYAQLNLPVPVVGEAPVGAPKPATPAAETDEDDERDETERDDERDDEERTA
jgi:hypothetical protein